MCWIIRGCASFIVAISTLGTTAHKTYFRATHLIFIQSEKLRSMWACGFHCILIIIHDFVKFILRFEQSSFGSFHSQLCLYNNCSWRQFTTGHTFALDLRLRFILGISILVPIKKGVRSARTYLTHPQPLRGPYGVVAVGVVSLKRLRITMIYLCMFEP